MIACAIGLVLLSAACSTDDGGMHVTPPVVVPVDTAPALPDSLTFNYLALGDSYTIGTGLPDPSGRYPLQLVARLNGEEGFYGGEVQIIAQNGWTTASLTAAINAANIDTTYSIVSLLIGVNNQFQNRPIAEFSEQFSALLQMALTFAAGDTSRVFVVTIPDYGVTPFGQNYNPGQIATAIDEFNDVIKTTAFFFNVSYFDITGISREAGANPGMLAPDNLHPSAQQYTLWVDSFYEQVKAKIK